MKPISDEEVTMLCAEAVEEPHIGFNAKGQKVYLGYDPLNNDEQAMALIKRFRLHTGVSGEYWWALCPDGRDSLIYRTTLNRAVCECVANLQKAR